LRPIYSAREVRAFGDKNKDDIRKDIILIEKSNHNLIANFSTQVRTVQDLIIYHIMDRSNHAREARNHRGVPEIYLHVLRLPPDQRPQLMLILLPMLMLMLMLMTIPTSMPMQMRMSMRMRIPMLKLLLILMLMPMPMLMLMLMTMISILPSAY